MEELSVRLAELEKKYELLSAKVDNITYDIANDEEYAKDCGVSSEMIKKKNIAKCLLNLYQDYLIKNNFDNTVTLKQVVDSRKGDRKFINEVGDFVNGLDENFESLDLISKNKILLNYMSLENSKELEDNIKIAMMCIINICYYLFTIDELTNLDEFTDYLKKKTKYFYLLNKHTLFTVISDIPKLQGHGYNKVKHYIDVDLKYMQAFDVLSIDYYRNTLIIEGLVL